MNIVGGILLILTLWMTFWKNTHTSTMENRAHGSIRNDSHWIQNSFMMENLTDGMNIEDGYIHGDNFLNYVLEQCYFLTTFCTAFLKHINSNNLLNNGNWDTFSNSFRNGDPMRWAQFECNASSRTFSTQVHVCRYQEDNTGQVENPKSSVDEDGGKGSFSLSIAPYSYSAYSLSRPQDRDWSEDLGVRNDRRLHQLETHADNHPNTSKSPSNRVGCTNPIPPLRTSNVRDKLMADQIQNRPRLTGVASTFRTYDLLRETQVPGGCLDSGQSVNQRASSEMDAVRMPSGPLVSETFEFQRHQFGGLDNGASSESIGVHFIERSVQTNGVLDTETDGHAATQVFEIYKARGEVIQSECTDHVSWNSIQISRFSSNMQTVQGLKHRGICKFSEWRTFQSNFMESAEWSNVKSLNSIPSVRVSSYPYGELGTTYRWKILDDMSTIDLDAMYLRHPSRHAFLAAAKQLDGLDMDMVTASISERKFNAPSEVGPSVANNTNAILLSSLYLPGTAMEEAKSSNGDIQLGMDKLRLHVAWSARLGLSSATRSERCRLHHWPSVLLSPFFSGCERAGDGTKPPPAHIGLPLTYASPCMQAASTVVIWISPIGEGNIYIFNTVNGSATSICQFGSYAKWNLEVGDIGFQLCRYVDCCETEDTDDFVANSDGYRYRYTGYNSVEDFDCCENEVNDVCDFNHFCEVDETESVSIEPDEVMWPSRGPDRHGKAETVAGYTSHGWQGGRFDFSENCVFNSNDLPQMSSKPVPGRCETAVDGRKCIINRCACGKQLGKYSGRPITDFLRHSSFTDLCAGIFTQRDLSHFQTSSRYSGQSYVNLRHSNNLLKLHFWISDDVEPNPGPDFTLSFKNITSIKSHDDHLLESPAQIQCFVEASAADAELYGLKANFTAAKRTLYLSKTDKECKHFTGGVGIATMNPLRCIEVEPLTKELAEIDGCGRAGIYAVQCSKLVTLTIVILYGWSGGAQDVCLANRTDDLIARSHCELQAQPDGPRLICRDSNANTWNIPTLVQALEESNHIDSAVQHEQWYDLGARAHLWNGVDNEPTCIGNNTEIATRRDFIFANHQALRMVKHFGVTWDVPFPVHAELNVTLDIDSPFPTELHVNKPKSFQELIDKHLRQQLKLESKDHIPLEAIKNFKAKLHEVMDKNFTEAAKEMSDLLILDDMPDVWQRWSDYVEKAFIECLDIKDEDRTGCCGHGKVDFIKKTAPMPTIDDCTNTLQPTGSHIESNRLRRQYRRCLQAATLLKLINGRDNHVHRNFKWKESLGRHLRALITDMNPEVEHEATLVTDIFNYDTDHPGIRIQFFKNADLFHNRYVVANGVYLKELKEKRNELLHADPVGAASCSRANGVKGHKLNALKRDLIGPQGQRVGSLTTNADEMDGILIRAWKAVYNGTKQNLTELSGNFVTKYGNEMLWRSEEFELPRLTGKELAYTCRHSKKSAAGMDAWESKDFNYISDIAVCHLADMLHRIEHGARWPDALLHARAAYLAKDKDKPYEPLAYRVLMLTPIVCRRYASTRLRHIKPWVREWAMDCMFAGVENLSAQEAWYHTSLLIEHARISGEPVAGATIDIFKCFDQVPRELLYRIIEAAGCPKQLITAYRSYQENVIGHNSILGTCGKGTDKRCGIPQGCPFSMCFIALFLRPWLMKVQAKGANARALADDMLILGIGSDCTSKLRDALNETHIMLEDMGAKIATNKPLTFSTCANIRQWLRKKHGMSLRHRFMSAIHLGIWDHI